MSKHDNKAPSDVNTSLDRSTYPRKKIKMLLLVENDFSRVKTQQATSVTCAATYKLMEPHYQKYF